MSYQAKLNLLNLLNDLPQSPEEIHEEAEVTYDCDVPRDSGATRELLDELVKDGKAISDERGMYRAIRSHAVCY